jgi:hypothetical protein
MDGERGERRLGTIARAALYMRAVRRHTEVRRAIFLLTAWCAAVSACGRGSAPTTPSPGGTSGYAGQWIGTTSQGRPITITVSQVQKVTAITVEYNFNGCSGVSTFTDLDLDIGSPPNPTPPSLGPGFGFGSGPPDGPNYTQVYGWFTSGAAATGSVIFSGYSGCGNSVGIWNATRR